VRLRILIDADKPELYGRQQPFWPLLGSGGALARRVISCPRPRRIALRKIRSRLSALRGINSPRRSATELTGEVNG
jgi:hypothetical protein